MNHNLTKLRRFVAMVVLCGILAVRPISASEALDSESVQMRIAHTLIGDSEPKSSLVELSRKLLMLTPGLSLDAWLEFRVAKIQAASQPGWHLVQMECAPRSGCLPFNVLVPPDVSLPEVSSRGYVPEAKTGAGVPGLTRRLLMAQPPAAHRGDRVALVEQRSGMRLETPAVCLQAGSEGQTIRVRNLTTKRVVLAKVLDRKTVSVE